MRAGDSATLSEVMPRGTESEQCLPEAAPQHTSPWPVPTLRVTVLRQLIPGAPELRLSRECTLYQEGDTADRIFFVVSGVIGLYLSTEHGHEVELAEQGEGSLVGMEALVSQAYDSSARASRAATLKVMTRRDVAALVETDARLCAHLLTDALLEVGRARHRLLDLAGRCAKERLVQELLRSIGMETAPALVPLPWGSKTRLARRLGIKQETLSRVLQELTEERTIRIVPGGLELLDLPRLRQIVE